MAIAGTEWLLLGAIALLVMMFRPDSIIALGLSAGKAVNEFKTGDNETFRQDRDELLAETAERLGIKTEGKETREISQEILARASRDSHQG
jgi:Sec-independent protein translocase protein TatA